MASASGGYRPTVIDVLLNDLRTLSTESRRRNEAVKDAAEGAIVKVRNISTTSDPNELQKNLQTACTEILHPFILGCSTKVPKIVQISLHSIHRALQYNIVTENVIPILVRELDSLTSAECEELRVLQTITLFVSHDTLVTGTPLAQCIVLAIKLNFSKNPSVINAASAAVRQLFSCVFERVVQEDGMYGLPQLKFPLSPELDYTERRHSPTFNCRSGMNTCASDGYLLLKDLVSLIRKENTNWLEGVKRFTMTLALELLESVLRNYPSIFFKHVQYAVVLRDIVCPQMLFILTGTHADRLERLEKPPFPVLMRCLRISLMMIKNYFEIIGNSCITFVQFIIHLLSSKHAEWQPVAALEVIHKIIGLPELLSWMIRTFHLTDETPKLVELLITSVASFTKKTIRRACDNDPIDPPDQNQPGFLCGDTFLPIHENVSAKRWILLDWLEKHEAGPIPVGYAISLAYAVLTDITHSVYAVVEELSSPSKRIEMLDKVEEHTKVSNELFRSVSAGLLDGLARLLVVSVEDSTTESLLNCLSTLLMMSCKTGNSKAREAVTKCLCFFALPNYYFDRFVVSAASAPAVNGNVSPSPPMFDLNDFDCPKVTQVVAVGTICPTPQVPMTATESFSVTAKNMDAARTLITAVDVSGGSLNDTWDMVWTTLQHFTWLLGMKPLPNGGFRTGGEATGGDSVGAGTVANTAPTTTVLTTAVSSELPELNTLMNKVVAHSYTYDEVGLHHVIASLCRLSTEQMYVAQRSAREPSFFAVSKLLQIATTNVFRLRVYWRPITAHLVEVCGHPHTKLREWGSIALTQLISLAMNQHVEKLGNSKEKMGDHISPEENVKTQVLIMTPLSQVNEIPYADVKQRQLECVVNLLQTASINLVDESWSILISAISHAATNTASNHAILQSGHAAISQIGKEFMELLSIQCLVVLLETVCLFGQQTLSINISLSAVSLLWNISDQLRIRSSPNWEVQGQDIWLLFFKCLGKLCTDERPAVRKSACDTLMQTIACHCEVLTADSWHTMLFEILFTLLENVRNQTRNASQFRPDDPASQRLLVHHSRDTPAKQWAETTVRTLFGVVKIFNTQRQCFSQRPDFPEAWARMLSYLEYTAQTDNAEMSLAALKDFFILHFSKDEIIDRNERPLLHLPSEKAELETNGKYDSDKKNTVAGLFRVVDAAPLPDKLWLMSWESYYRIGKTLTTGVIFGTDGVEKLRFVPGPFHWTTYLQIFPSLFIRVKHLVNDNELEGDRVLAILRKIASAPKSTDQTPFSLTTANPDLSPAHEAVLEVVKVIFLEEISKGSKHRKALPPLIKLLLEFTEYALEPPSTDFIVSRTRDKFAAGQSISVAPFCELCMRIVVEYYTKVAAFNEVINDGVFGMIVDGFAKPMSIRYGCHPQTLWLTAATMFIAASRVALPIAREKMPKFERMWIPFVLAIEKFVFASTKGTNFNCDERKRYEFVDCQIIEMLRVEILPYSVKLPWDFMQRVIDVLNSASVATLDSCDVLDLSQQRTDLCRVSFDALLSLTHTEILGKFNPVGVSSSGKPRSIGGHAITALIVRCKKILNNYARDEQAKGYMPQLSARVAEVVSVCRAISALIEGLSKQTEAVVEVIYENLIDLYPVIVGMVPCCKSSNDIQFALMIALNSYQTLLILKSSNPKSKRFTSN
uniref:Protein MON2 homolog n=1 Tax=Panagrellus redivivus TaxID=6233 RepID=A0A7E4V301_PANRE